MEARIPSNLHVQESLAKIRERAIQLVAELQVIDMQIQAMLQEDATQLGVLSMAKDYDFVNNEFILEVESPEGQPEIDPATTLEEKGVNEEWQLPLEEKGTP